MISIQGEDMISNYRRSILFSIAMTHTTRWSSVQMCGRYSMQAYTYQCRVKTYIFIKEPLHHLGAVIINTGKWSFTFFSFDAIGNLSTKHKRFCHRLQIIHMEMCWLWLSNLYAGGERLAFISQLKVDFFLVLVYLIIRKLCKLNVSEKKRGRYKWLPW